MATLHRRGFCPTAAIPQKGDMRPFDAS
jgi:hypothetical protein